MESMQTKTPKIDVDEVEVLLRRKSFDTSCDLDEISRAMALRDKMVASGITKPRVGVQMEDGVLTVAHSNDSKRLLEMWNAQVACVKSNVVH